MECAAAGAEDMEERVEKASEGEETAWAAEEEAEEV